MREELGMGRRIVRPAAAVGLDGRLVLFRRRGGAGAGLPLRRRHARGLVISVVATIVTLFAVGAAKTIITTRPWWRSGLESMATGIVAAAVTYGAGRFFARR